jgi:hypothetical protein
VGSRVGQTETGDGTRLQRNGLVLDVIAEEGKRSIRLCPNVRIENTGGKQRASLE